jgi:hypothetical protein
MRRFVGLLIGITVLASACGGGDDSGVSAAPTTASSSDAPSTAAATTAASGGSAATSSGSEVPAGELPDFSQDFDRLCTSQVGYRGAAAYDQGGAGPHPVIVFTEDGFEDDSFIESSPTLPDGWLVQQDSNFEDNSDLAVTQLVACADRTSTTPNGTSCDFDNDGEKLSLTLVDATYDLIVYNASTGAEVGRSKVDASTTDCPFFVFVDEGQTDYVNRPTDDDLTSALKPFVAP